MGVKHPKINSDPKMNSDGSMRLSFHRPLLCSTDRTALAVSMSLYLFHPDHPNPVDLFSVRRDTSRSADGAAGLIASSNSSDQILGQEEA